MKSAFELAYEELAAMKIVLRQAPAEYRVNHRGGHPEMDYRTEDLQDALERGRLMGMLGKTLEPPLGPLGPKPGRRGQMYRHNRKLAEKRRKGSGKE